MNRMRRQAQAQETLEISRRGNYLATDGTLVDIASDIQKAIQSTRLFRPQDCAALAPRNADIEYSIDVEVTGETTLQAAQRLASLHQESSRTLCLNFASAKNPGGGFLSGAQAQEESLARSSALYVCQLSQPEMYDFHRRLGTCLYSDHMILSPSVPVFRDDDGTLLQTPFLCSFVTSPAVNAGAVRRNEPHNVAQIEPTMRERLRKILVLARHFEYSNLVLGAWGCGVFQNEPDFVARLMHEMLGRNGEFGKSFERIVYAVYDTTPEQKVLASFQRKFKDQMAA